ncbi:hypothetical protein MOTT12_04019 [Mycobacterium intracellulare subsp. yongonense]|nr:hypothetical protein MOTT12_04019 [Mycobacterium intracellulare subsp. yongonense]ARR84752.1 hypothetical protein MOTT27_03931 [Mycobacterium intracellulare subsp. yongonense]
MIARLLLIALRALHRHRAGSESLATPILGDVALWAPNVDLVRQFAGIPAISRRSAG